jgi:regulator of extracellular matrix RemA (YlzA/DUF370 family)
MGDWHERGGTVYLHLGDDIIISGDKIIAIINLDEPVSEVLKELIDDAEVDKILHTISRNDKKKALVLCDDCHYLSPISSNTLYKRAIQFRKEV